MNKTIVGSAAALGLLGVALGALGSHALRGVLSTASLESFQTGVRYQMFHALFLLFLGIENSLGPRSRKQLFVLILTGTLCFSGSIYLLSTTQVTGLDLSAFWWVTPLGGLLLILGWLGLLYRVFRLKN